MGAKPMDKEGPLYLGMSAYTIHVTLPLNQNYRKAEKIQALSSNPSIDETKGTCSAWCTCAPL